MNGQERRQEIIRLLMEGNGALSGSGLAKRFGVSRQVIVQDIALIRANGMEVVSTNRGYILTKASTCSRVFKLQHSEEETMEELFLIVDCGGSVEDVFVYHTIYNTVRGEMHIHSRKDVEEFIRKLEGSKSSLLLNVTSGYHYHTVCARDEETLDLIQEKLQERGFLAKLQDFEPVDFWTK